MPTLTITPYLNEFNDIRYQAVEKNKSTTKTFTGLSHIQLNNHIQRVQSYNPPMRITFNQGEPK